MQTITSGCSSQAGVFGWNMNARIVRCSAHPDRTGIAVYSSKPLLTLRLQGVIHGSAYKLLDINYTTTWVLLKETIEIR